MKTVFQSSTIGQWHADCAVVFVFEDTADKAGAAKSLAWLKGSPALADFKGKKGEFAMCYGNSASALPRALFVGLGKKVKCSLQDFRSEVAKSVVECRKRGFANLALISDNLLSLSDSLGLPLEEFFKESVCSAHLGLYRMEKYRGEAKKDIPADPEHFDFLFDGEPLPSLIKSAKDGEAEALGVILARDLSNGPANYITPSVLAEQAQRLAKDYGFTCTVFGPDEIEQMGMGALMAVARGAKEEPRFIVLEHCPLERKTDDPLIFVGKGITFDTGGISLKPPAKMHEMKGDMGGGAAVLGLFEAIGRMEDKAALPRIIGIIPSTENMPGGRATRPGDVVTTFSGQTVEILNTDAEGRLILCDALAYAQKNWKPRAIIDAATLTGACVVALGDYATGLFSRDKDLSKLIMDSCAATGDLCWPMPMWEEYDDNLKSDVADMANVGPREGGAISAALFLQRFVNKETPWAHLDIAGPGYVVKPSPLHPVPGGTGVGVRLFCKICRES